MTYKESYEKCENLEELKTEVNSDIIIAGIIGNIDRLKVIKLAAEEVANENFNTNNIQFEED